MTSEEQLLSDDQNLSSHWSGNIWIASRATTAARPSQGSVHLPCQDTPPSIRGGLGTRERFFEAKQTTAVGGVSGLEQCSLIYFDRSINFPKKEKRRSEPDSTCTSTKMVAYKT